MLILWRASNDLDARLEPTPTVEQKEAAVASAAILVHSAIDYPLRTAAIMAVMAVCVALLAGAKGPSRSRPQEQGQVARHATL